MLSRTRFGFWISWSKCGFWQRFGRGYRGRLPGQCSFLDPRPWVALNSALEASWVAFSDHSPGSLPRYLGPKGVPTDGRSRGETWPGLGLLYLEYLAYINQLTTLYALRSKRCLHFSRFDNKRVGFRPSGRGACVASMPTPHPDYSLLGFRVLPPNPPSKEGFVHNPCGRAPLRGLRVGVTLRCFDGAVVAKQYWVKSMEPHLISCLKQLRRIR